MVIFGSGAESRPAWTPHDGNHSTCGYLGVIWTPWRDSNSLLPIARSASFRYLYAENEDPRK